MVCLNQMYFKYINKYHFPVIVELLPCKTSSCVTHATCPPMGHHLHHFSSPSSSRSRSQQDAIWKGGCWLYYTLLLCWFHGMGNEWNLTAGKSWYSLAIWQFAMKHCLFVDDSRTIRGSPREGSCQCHEFVQPQIRYGPVWCSTFGSRTLRSLMRSIPW